LDFPTGADVPASGRHKELLVLLWQSVQAELGNRALVASDMFLYWDPTDPKRCLAPDLAVRIGAPAETLECWKTWERGAPHVGVEIVSRWDRSETRLEKTLERYCQAGILEVVRFDPERQTSPVRLWDLFDGDLVERDLGDPEAYRCDALALYWCVRQHPRFGPMLRLARDAKGERVLPTPWEAEDAAVAAKDIALAELAAARARIAELEKGR
ncbi:MAG TPA: Uma2 family endonuclease, partial [Polyangiaceae bacterium]|nr:Uma2 family endonuclease [Polyangiaceae bacterium]